MAPNPMQNYLQRFLAAVDNPGGTPARPRGGLIGSIEAIQTLAAEGITRGYIAPPGGTATNPPVQADLTLAGYPQLTPAAFATLVATLQNLNATVLANSAAIMQTLYTVRT
jgi:hypothetical protein